MGAARQSELTVGRLENKNGSVSDDETEPFLMTSRKDLVVRPWGQFRNGQFHRRAFCELKSEYL